MDLVVASGTTHTFRFFFRGLPWPLRQGTSTGLLAKRRRLLANGSRSSFSGGLRIFSVAVVMCSLRHVTATIRQLDAEIDRKGCALSWHEWCVAMNKLQDWTGKNWWALSDLVAFGSWRTLGQARRVKVTYEPHFRSVTARGGGGTFQDKKPYYEMTEPPADKTEGWLESSRLWLIVTHSPPNQLTNEPTNQPTNQSSN